MLILAAFYISSSSLATSIYIGNCFIRFLLTSYLFSSSSVLLRPLILSIVPLRLYFWISALPVVYFIPNTLEAYLTLMFYSNTNFTKALLAVVLIESYDKDFEFYEIYVLSKVYILFCSNILLLSIKIILIYSHKPVRYLI